MCAGEIVSQATFTAMTTADPDAILDGTYGFGLFDTTGGYGRGAVGHQGELFGYMS
jgi:hypothetical protein